MTFGLFRTFTETEKKWRFSVHTTIHRHLKFHPALTIQHARTHKQLSANSGWHMKKNRNYHWQMWMAANRWKSHRRKRHHSISISATKIKKKKLVYFVWLKILNSKNERSKVSKWTKTIANWNRIKVIHLNISTSIGRISNEQYKRKKNKKLRESRSEDVRFVISCGKIFFSLVLYCVPFFSRDVLNWKVKCYMLMSTLILCRTHSFSLVNLLLKDLFLSFIYIY